MEGSAVNSRYTQVLVINAEVPGGEFLALVVIYTVFMSLVAHGITANPLAKWLGNKETNL